MFLDVKCGTLISAHEAGFEPQPPHGTSFPLHLIRYTPLIRDTRSPDAKKIVATYAGRMPRRVGVPRDVRTKLRHHEKLQANACIKVPKSNAA
jgi:hypothetical protein